MISFIIEIGIKEYIVHQPKTELIKITPRDWILSGSLPATPQQKNKASL